LFYRERIMETDGGEIWTPYILSKISKRTDNLPEIDE
jgi:hypothetical protein